MAGLLSCAGLQAARANEFPPPQPANAASAIKIVRVPARSDARGMPPTAPAPASEPAPPPPSRSSGSAGAIAAVATLAGLAGLAEIKSLKNKIEVLSKENEALQKTNAELSQRLAESNSGNADQRRRIEAQVSQLSAAKDELQGARRDARKQAAELDVRQHDLAEARHRIEALEVAAANGTARERRLSGQLEAIRRDRWLWAALAAALAGAMAAAGVRRWWPRRVTVAKPLSVSVEWGPWSAQAGDLAAAGDATFRVVTQWLPCGSAVVAPAGAGLLLKGDIVALHGQAA
ncbi:hypothetical protein [Roseateles sp.]|uniref:hypothetical protein n=1 Tax=Roseateles sp. TaxID=1971397 RepID=UPI0025D61D30|nr:hypothetical protein [Roseateles sp.]MBV8036420.1 hypothetical protein [Roseateles sp.]